MKKIGEMVGVLELNNRDFMRGMKKSVNTLPNFSTQFKKMGKTMVRISRVIVKSIFSMKTALMALAGAYVLKKVADSFISAASTAEGFRVRLKVLLGSVKEGNKLFKSMAVFASGVSFEYKEIMGGATALAGVMKDGVKEIEAWMPMIADLAAAAGMGITETIGQVIRMYSAGAAAADMFRERGILAMMGFKAGAQYSAEETQKQMFKAWNAIDSKFKDASKELATTWAGMLSMIRDKWFQFRNIVMDAGIYEVLKKALSDINDRFGQWIKDNEELIKQKVPEYIDAIGKTARAVVDAFIGISEGIEKIRQAWADTPGILKKIMIGMIRQVIQWDAIELAIKAVRKEEEVLNKVRKEIIRDYKTMTILELLWMQRIGKATELEKIRLELLKRTVNEYADLETLIDPMLLKGMWEGIDKTIYESYMDGFKKVERELMAKAMTIRLDWEVEPLPPLFPEVKKTSAEALSAMRSMYEDMRDYGADYFDVLEDLIDEQAKAYEELGIKQVTIDKWVTIEKKKLSEIRSKIVLDETAGMMANWSIFFKQLGQTSKKWFRIYKLTAIAQAIIKTYQGAVEAFTALAGIPIVGPALGTAAAVAAIAAGLTQVAVISAQEPPSTAMALGGWLEEHPGGGKIGEGTPGKDDVFLGASPGIRHWGMRDEFVFVMNKEATKQHGALLETMNEGMAGGGWLDKRYFFGGGFPGLPGFDWGTIPGAGLLEELWEDLTEGPTAPAATAAVFDPKVFAGILNSIDKLLGKTSALDDAMASANKQFDDWKKQLIAMGASAEQLAQVESQRVAVLAHIRAELEVEAWESVNDKLADLLGTFTAFEKQVISINDQFDAMIDQLEDINATEAQLAAVEAQRALAIQHLIDVQKETLEEDLRRRLMTLTGPPEELAIYDLTREFEETIELIKEWADETGQDYDDLIAQTTEVYKLEMEAALAQSEAAKDIRGAINKWLSVIANLNRTIYEMQTTLTSPADVEERMQFIMDQILGFGEAATPEEMEELRQLWMDYLNLAQEAYQRPSVEYQAIYDTVLSTLEGLRDKAEGFISEYEVSLDQLATLEDMLTTEQGMATSLEQIAADIMAGIPVEVSVMIIPDLTAGTGEYTPWAPPAPGEDWDDWVASLPGEGLPKAQHGAIFSGPEGGYPVMMHGREAVVKLQDGLGMDDLGGKTELNLSISIDGSGSPRDVAIETRKEVEGFLRSNRGRKMVKQASIGRV